MEELTTDEVTRRLTLWAAQSIGVDPGEVARVETDQMNGCDTCEFCTIDIDVRLTDGRTYRASNTFGLWLADIVSMDIAADGTVTTYGERAGELWQLQEIASRSGE